MPVTIDSTALEAALSEAVDGEVRFTAGDRHLYSTDSSNYRQVPLGVVLPRTTEAMAAAVAVCRQFNAPITHRGGGTSSQARPPTRRSSSTPRSTCGPSSVWIRTHDGPRSSPAASSMICATPPKRIT